MQPTLLVTILSLLSLVFAWGETPDQVAQRSRALLTDPSTFGVGILSTIYNDEYPVKELRGSVASGSDYFASCHANGDLVVLALPVSQNWKNALSTAGKNATIAIVSNADPSIPDPRFQTPDGQWDPSRPNWRRGMYSKQRLTLFGHLETFKKEEDDTDKKLKQCYLATHPDASHFIPGSKDSPHLAIWSTFVVDRVYRVGGYGDESQIGWLDMDRWHRAGRRSKEEWQAEWHAMSKAKADASAGATAVVPLDGDRIASLFGESPVVTNGLGGLVFQ